MFLMCVVNAQGFWGFRAFGCSGVVKSEILITVLCVFSPQGRDKENRPVGVRGLRVHQPPAALLWGNSMREEHDRTVLSARPRLWASYRGFFYFWLCDFSQQERTNSLQHFFYNSSSLRLIFSSHAHSDSYKVLLEAKTQQTKAELEKFYI